MWPTFKLSTATFQQFPSAFTGFTCLYVVVFLLAFLSSGPGWGWPWIPSLFRRIFFPQFSLTKFPVSCLFMHLPIYGAQETVLMRNKLIEFYVRSVKMKTIFFKENIWFWPSLVIYFEILQHLVSMSQYCYTKYQPASVHLRQYDREIIMTRASLLTCLKQIDRQECDQQLTRDFID